MFLRSYKDTDVSFPFIHDQSDSLTMIVFRNSRSVCKARAKFPHSPILRYTCNSFALFLLFSGGETKDYIH